ncbi:DUF6431 domain-containing protein [Paenibacillus elgii]
MTLSGGSTAPTVPHPEVTSNQIIVVSKYHLPDLLVPYRHYDADGIEGTASAPLRTDIAAEGSTIARLNKPHRNFFKTDSKLFRLN